MAKFIIGNALRNKARNKGLLRQLLWLLDLLLIACLYGFFKLLPVDWASRLGRKFGSWLGPKMASRSRNIKANLSLALKSRSKAEIDALVPKVWGNAGAVLAEYPHMGRILDPNSGRVEVVVEEPIVSLEDPTQPAIFVSAHLSNWELIAGTIATRYRIPFVALYSPPANPWLDRLLLRSRRQLGCDLMPRDQSARGLMRALKERRSVALVMDRRTQGGLPVPLFGEDKPASNLPAKLALKFNCPLVPVKIERLKDACFRVTFCKPLKSHDPAGDEAAQVRDLTRQIHQHFEQWIEAAPEDWFCSKKIWPKDVLEPYSG